ncbi:SGNH/GDSL hydrolase family protein [Bacillus sp. BHET2]|uniref:SGNH/GDSL hydrolase family protein n=1 Tax=Bacillus sp. BHET2 TaxID=2583818 RepID=UPI00110E01EC|nr:SGNH/GDSL hydrolase family protein [Bacillus sp. BHET2]TMU84243.1 SGNH/GDSL hydrolase family protein [Bacillus sp. BHET2]
MKKFLLIVLAVMTISTVIGGKYHWNQKVSAVQTKVNVTEEKSDEGIVEESKSIESQKVEAEPDKDRLVKLDKVNFLPKELQPIFQKAIEEQRPVNLMITGSSSTSHKDGAWPQLLESKLLDTYGDSLIHVTIKEIGGKTSQQVVKESIYKKMVNMKPDILLLEPFLLYDNGEIRMSERLKNISKIIKSFKKANPDMTILIQPANPIYGAYYYTDEENDLERYAKQNNYTYLDHWKAWPDYNKSEIEDYLTEGNVPNDKGNETWAKYLKEYFVRDDEKE